MADPRADNCKAFHLTNNQVDGVLLEYRENPDSKYQLTYVKLIGEAEAGGATVASFAVYDKNGMPVAENVYLAWPWPDMTNKLLPGNPNQQHMISNGFDAAHGVIGPLAMFVGGPGKEVISDVIGGLGLPNNRHVCYQLVWKERGTADDGGGGDDGGASPDVTHLHEDLHRLAAHLGLAL